MLRVIAVALAVYVMKETLIQAAIVVGAAVAYFVAAKLDDPSAVNRLRFAAVLTAMVAALPACNAMREVVWPTETRCTPPAETLVSDLLEILRRDSGAKLTERAVEAVEELARIHGPSAVACAMNDVSRRLFGASGEEGVVAAKAQEWLDRHGVAIEELPPGAAERPR